ncbi:MAG: FHA domain-containing protein [Victivallales bacterium]|nr:FHA domain-containing protein [Victivallales bacterium]
MKFGSRKMHIRLEFDGRTLYEIDEKDIKSDITIGREEDNAWKLSPQDTKAHRHHAVLRRQRGSLVLSDCEKREDIFYLGKKVKERRLQIGDICGLGDSKLVVEECLDDANKSGRLFFNQLEQLTGEAKGTIYQIKETPFKMGKIKECQCLINDPLISSIHAEIRFEEKEGCWRIYDNKSKNGTTLNGRKVQGTTGVMLKDGDIIGIAYIKFKYWDKNVVHVRSHFVLKLCAIVATLGLVLGGYFGFQTIMPNAKTLRLRAELLAAHEQFAQAGQLLKQASEARGAEVDKMQRTDLGRKLALWQETRDNWRQMQQGVANETDKGNFYLLCAKLAANDIECWSWNPAEGLAQMKQAQETNSLLVYTRSCEEALKNSVSEEKYLREQLGKLEAIVRKCAQEPLSFRAKLQARAEDTLRELKETLETSATLQKLLLDYKDVAQSDEIVERIQKMSRECDEHQAARTKAGRPASKLVQRQCDGYLEPMAMLQKSYAVLMDNYRALAKMEFDKFQPALPLPGHDACVVATTLSARRADMENANKNLINIRRNMENYRKRFDRDFPKGKSPMLKELFADETSSQVLAFDCLAGRMPSYSDKQARSQYDKCLGIYVFFEYLRSLDAEFDTTVLEERFKPVVFLAADLCRSLESFLGFCRPPAHSPLKPQMELLLKTSPHANQIQELVEQAEAILKQRDDYVRELYGVFRNNRSSRRGIVAGGMACVLMTKGHTFIDGKLADEVSKAFKELRKKLADITATTTGEVSPEKMLAAERDLLELGIPGDPFIKQPWTDKFDRK